MSKSLREKILVQLMSYEIRLVIQIDSRDNQKFKSSHKSISKNLKPTS